MTSDGPPDGVHYLWVPDPGWAVPPRSAGRCRYTEARRVCGAPAVASLNRSQRAGRHLWWDYCADHLYGRMLLDGVVYVRIVTTTPPEP